MGEAGKRREGKERASAGRGRCLCQVLNLDRHGFAKVVHAVGAE